MKEFSLTGTVCDFSVDHNALTIETYLTFTIVWWKKLTIK